MSHFLTASIGIRLKSYKSKTVIPNIKDWMGGTRADPTTITYCLRAWSPGFEMIVSRHAENSCPLLAD